MFFHNILFDRVLTTSRRKWRLSLASRRSLFLCKKFGEFCWQIYDCDEKSFENDRKKTKQTILVEMFLRRSFMTAWSVNLDTLCGWCQFSKYSEKEKDEFSWLKPLNDLITNCVIRFWDWIRVNTREKGLAVIYVGRYGNIPVVCIIC